MTLEHNISNFRIWLMAARPKTLPAGIVPVMVAGIMAYGDGVFHLWSFGAALVGALAIQIGTNYANDLFDYLKNTDRSDRIGPTRVTQAGLASPRQITVATFCAFGIAVLAGVYLIYRGGWPIAVIGITSIICGVIYTATPYALGYLGLADLFVLIYFGPVALGGTYYAQARSITPAVIIAGIPFGMISTAILTVNNLRDIDSDGRSGKKTLAVRFGRSFARYEYAAMLLGAALAPLVIIYSNDNRQLLLLPMFYLILAGPVIKTIFTVADGEKLNRALAATGRLLILYGLLFGVGWIITNQ